VTNKETAYLFSIDRGCRKRSTSRRKREAGGRE